MSSRRELISHLRRVQMLTSSKRIRPQKKRALKNKQRPPAYYRQEDAFDAEQDLTEIYAEQRRKSLIRDDNDLEFFYSLFHKEKEFKRLMGRMKTHIYFIYWCNRYERKVINKKYNKHYHNPNISSYVDQFPSTYMKPTINLSTKSMKESTPKPTNESIAYAVKKVSRAFKQSQFEAKEKESKKPKKMIATTTQTVNTDPNYTDDLINYASNILSQRSDSESSKFNSNKNSFSSKSSRSGLEMSPAFELHTKKVIVSKGQQNSLQQNSSSLSSQQKKKKKTQNKNEVENKKPSHAIFDLSSSSNDPFTFDINKINNTKRQTQTRNIEEQPNQQQQPKRIVRTFDQPANSVISIKPTEPQNKVQSNQIQEPVPNKPRFEIQNYNSDSQDDSENIIQNKNSTKSKISYDITISPKADDKQSPNKNTKTEINMSLDLNDDSTANTSDQFQITSNKKIEKSNVVKTTSSNGNKTQTKYFFNVDTDSTNNDSDFVDFDIPSLKKTQQPSNQSTNLNELSSNKTNSLFKKQLMSQTKITKVPESSSAETSSSFKKQPASQTLRRVFPLPCAHGVICLDHKEADIPSYIPKPLHYSQNCRTPTQTQALSHLHRLYTSDLVTYCEPTNR